MRFRRALAIVAICGLAVSIIACTVQVESPLDPAKKVPVELALLQARQMADDIEAKRDADAAAEAARIRKAQRDAQAKLQAIELEASRQAAAVTAEIEDASAESTATIARITANARREATKITETTGLSVELAERAQEQKFAIARGVVKAGQDSGVPLLATGAGIIASLATGLGWFSSSRARKFDLAAAEAKAKADREAAVKGEQAVLAEHKSTWDEATRTAPATAPDQTALVTTILETVLARVMPAKAKVK